MGRGKAPGYQATKILAQRVTSFSHLAEYIRDNTTFRHNIFDFKVMDVHSYFGEASTPSTSASRLGSSSSEDEYEVESLELKVNLPKKHCPGTVRLNTPTSTKKRENIPSSNKMRTAKVPSVRSAESLGSHFT